MQLLDADRRALNAIRSICCWSGDAFFAAWSRLRAANLPSASTRVRARRAAPPAPGCKLARAARRPLFDPRILRLEVRAWSATRSGVRTRMADHPDAIAPVRLVARRHPRRIQATSDCAGAEARSSIQIFVRRVWCDERQRTSASRDLAQLCCSARSRPRWTREQRKLAAQERSRARAATAVLAAACSTSFLETIRFGQISAKSRTVDTGAMPKAWCAILAATPASGRLPTPTTGAPTSDRLLQGQVQPTRIMGSWPTSTTTAQPRRRLRRARRSRCSKRCAGNVQVGRSRARRPTCRTSARAARGCTRDARRRTWTATSPMRGASVWQQPAYVVATIKPDVANTDSHNGCGTTVQVDHDRGVRSCRNGGRARATTTWLLSTRRCAKGSARRHRRRHRADGSRNTATRYGGGVRPRRGRLQPAAAQASLGRAATRRRGTSGSDGYVAAMLNASRAVCAQGF